MFQKFKSRKFLLGLGVTLLMYLSEAFGMDISAETAALIVAPTVAFILGEAAVDTVRNKSHKES